MAEKQTTGNTFTEEGRLSQVEFAIKSVGEAGTTIGIACTNGVVLIGVNSVKSTSTEKIYKVNENTHVAVSGIFSDALRLLKYARVTSAEVEEEIGKCLKPSVLCELVSQVKQEFTQMASSRPYGVAFLYTGYENDEYVLFSTDPSGTINKWRACSFGMDAEAINSCLRNEIKENECTVDEGLNLLLKVYGKAKEWTPDLKERLEILKFTHEGSKMLEMEEISKLIEKIEAEKELVVDNEF
ncbi:hypothetical protein GINT2_001960 [Glugoides intestinalis]